MKRGFSLIEVIIATVIMSLGLISILASFNQCQRAMGASKRFETAQYALGLGEMLHPMPEPDQVRDDPLSDKLLNIPAETASAMADELGVELSRQKREELSDYTFERTVDEISDEELERNGHIYTVRTTVRWELRDPKPREETVITFWRKE